MKWTVLLTALLTVLGALPAFAQAGFYLPTSSPSYGQDEFRAADGTTCRSTMDGTKRVELGTFATGGNGTSGYGYGLPGYGSQPTQGNAGVYGRFSMSLDASPSRMDCNLLYKLEIERRTLELELMKRSLSSADQRLDEQMGADASHAEPSAGPLRKTAAGPKTPPKPVSKVVAAKRGTPPP